VKDWYEYLTEEFKLKKEAIRSRDRVVVTCPTCTKTSVVLVSNLTQKIKRSGKYECFSCSSKKAALNRAPRKPKSSDRVIAYLRKYNQKIPETPVNTNSRLELTCACGVKMVRGMKNLVKKGNPPLCGKCLNHQQNKEYYKKLENQTREKAKKYLRQFYHENVIEQAFDNFPPYVNIPCFEDCDVMLKVEAHNLCRNPDKPPRCGSCSVSTGKTKGEKSMTYTKKLHAYLKEHDQDIPNRYYKNTEKLNLKCTNCGAGIQKTPQAILNYPNSAPRCRMCSGKDSATSEAKDRFKETMLATYGVDNPMKLEEIKTKAQDTLKNRDRTNPSKLELVFHKILNDEGLKFVTHDYNTLKGKEIDILLPEHGVGIDPGALYWHSAKFKDKKYHQKKFEAAGKEGVTLLQFFSDEVETKEPIVSSIVKSKLGRSVRYYARKTEVVSLSFRESSEFLKRTHLMGPGPTAKGLGLRDKSTGVLLAVVTYKKHKTGVDIVRFANELNITVVGGLSKLLKQIERLEDPEFIQSFVDLRYGTGESLKTLGFVLEGVTLGWQWTDFTRTFNRRACRANMDKRKLTEAEHAEELGWVKIYDAGQAKWVKKKGGP